MQEVLEKTEQKPAFQENRMGTQPMFSLIVSMSLPAMFSMLIQALYNVVDSVFVAQWGSDAAMTAVSLAFPVQMLMISFAVGTGIGINSLVSRRLGERRQSEANNAATHGLLLAVATGLLFMLVGALFARPFISLFTPTANVAAWGGDYLFIVTVFSMGAFVEIALEKTLQATGNMLFPMLFQLSGAVVNIILDPIMIFGLFGFPEMGVAGAAVATVIGQLVSMIFSLIIVFARSHAVVIRLRGFRLQWSTVGEIYRVGIPSILMQSIGSVLTTALNWILKDFTEAAVAVLGGYYKLQSFIFMPVFGLTHGLMPILGFNYGARKKKRIYSALKIGMLIAVGIMAAGLLVFELFPDKLLGIFNASSEVLEIGVPAFRIIALCFLPAAAGIIISTLFQAIGMGAKSLLISVLRQLVLILPAAYLLSRIGLSYVWLAFPLAEAIALVISVTMVVGVLKNHIAKIREPSSASGD